MNALAFLSLALLLTVLTLAAIVMGYVGAGRERDPDAHLAPIRRHLAEIDTQHTLGLISDEDHQSTRAEAARRLIATAAQAAPHSSATARPGRAPGSLWGLAVLVAVLAATAYLVIAAPGLPDLPYRARLAAWRNTDPSRLTPQEIGAVLADIAKQHPDDPDPLKHLALVRRASDDGVGAVQALRKAVALAPDRADLWTDLGEAFVSVAKGEIDEDARWAFGQALARDPSNPSARYHLARARVADGQLAAGLADWRALLADLPAQDPRRPALAAELAVVTALGALPPAPDEAGRPAAPSPILRMVQGLAERLNAQPDDPDGWVRLVRAYAVLADRPRRDAALATATVRFADQPKVIAALRQAAEGPVQRAPPAAP